MENKGNISIVNIKKDRKAVYDLYIGRQNDYIGLDGSKWSNPLHLRREGDRPMILEQHEAYLRARPDLIAALPELTGKTLACYCCNYTKETGVVGRLCHGLNIIKLYDEFVK